MNVKRKSKKLRYKIMFKIMRILTPDLYRKIDLYSNMINYFAVLLGKEKQRDIDKVPRPAIKFMKQFFNGKSLIGCEVGVKSGYNSESMLKELNIEKLYLVDAWTEYEGFRGIKGLDKYYLQVLDKFQDNPKIEILKGYSNRMCYKIPDNSLHYVYIDGNHSEYWIKADLNNYYPKIIKGGLITGHDIPNLPDVYKSVLEWCELNNKAFFIAPPDFIIFC